MRKIMWLKRPFIFTLLLLILTSVTYGITSSTAASSTLANSSPALATYSVTNTNDSGSGSLRQAITDANANSTPPSNIVFNIPTSDPGFDGSVFTLQPNSSLPTILNNVIIDGSTQTTFTGDTNPFGPEVVVQIGFGISGDNNQIKNLVINHGGIGINYYFDHTPSYNQILNNYIGTDPTGSQPGQVIGGSVWISGYGSAFAQANQNVIEGNLISGSSSYGIGLCDADGTVITNNLIGVDRTGTLPIGNALGGILLTCAGAPNNQIMGNTIAFNLGEGILDQPGYDYPVAYTPDGHQANRFSQNSIFANGGLGINLLPPPFGYYDEVTPNDPGDTDPGGNLLQNFPVLTGAQSDGTSLVITGTLNSNANQSFTVELFLNTMVDDSGYGQGEIYLSSVTVNTDGNGDGSFSTTLSQEATAGQAVTATATDGAGNTSEFSAALLVQIQPTASFATSSPDILGETTLFTNTSTGTDLTYLWNFGDGNTSTDENPTHPYSDAGTYTVTLTTSNTLGNSIVKEAVAVLEIPSASFISSSPDALGTSTIFTNTSAGTDLSYLWNFGDGMTSTVTHPTHEYVALGTYTVILTATNEVGVSSASDPVEILEAPIASFLTSSPDTVGETTLFTNTSSGTALTYLWDFGDGNTSTETNPSHLYLSVGTFTINLTATNSVGTDTKVGTVKINGIPGPVYLPLIVRSTPCLSSGYEIEPNDSAAQATGPLCFNQAYFGTPEESSWDFFYFSLNSPGTITIALNDHPLSSELGVQVFLYYQSVSSSALVMSDLLPPYQITYTGQGGIYYVVIYNDLGKCSLVNCSIPYSLEIFH